MPRDEWTRYSPLLVWAVLRKVERGMRLWEVAEVYGIPEVTLKYWLHHSR